MKKVVIGLLVIGLFFSQKTVAFADICTPVITPRPPIEPGTEVTVTYDLSSQTDLSGYVIKGYNTGSLLQNPYDLSSQDTDLLSKTVSSRHTVQADINIWLERNGNRVCGTRETTIDTQTVEPTCSAGAITVVGLDAAGNEITDYTFNDPTLRVKFNRSSTQNFPSPSIGLGAYGLVLKDSGNSALNGGNAITQVSFDPNSGQAFINNDYIDFANPGVGQYYISIGTYSPRGTGGGAISILDYTGNDVAGCRQLFVVSEDGENTPPTNPTSSEYDICEQIPDKSSQAWQNCDTCRNKSPRGIWTAVGCIQTDTKTIVTQVVQMGLGLAGGVALLMIVAAGFLFSTSQNDPKKVTEARDLMTSAIIGLLFIIFSVTILQFVGVTILRIPGFGG